MGEYETTNTGPGPDLTTLHGCPLPPNTGIVTHEDGTRAFHYPMPGHLALTLTLFPPKKRNKADDEPARVHLSCNRFLDAEHAEGLRCLLAAAEAWRLAQPHQVALEVWS